MSIQFRIEIQDDLSKQLQQVQRDIAQLPQESFEYFRSITPIRSGNARRRTSLKNQTIHADYPYAQRLDTGWSRQAPQGMTKPTEKFIQRRMKNIMGKR